MFHLFKRKLTNIVSNRVRGRKTLMRVSGYTHWRKESQIKIIQKIVKGENSKKSLSTI